MNNFFIVHSSCRLVKGVTRSCVYDMDKRLIFFIPNDLYNILTAYKKKSIDFIKENFNNNYDEIIDEYFDFLIEKEIVFLCKEIELDFFEEIELDFEINSIISNSIIDFNLDFDYSKIINELSLLGCKFIQLRLFNNNIKLNHLNNILKFINESNILNIEIIIPFSTYENEFLMDFLINFSKISKIFFLQFT